MKTKTNMVVEAAGVEPASEKARHEENYVRFRFRVFVHRFRAGKRRRRLSPIDLGLRLRTEALGLSRKMTPTGRCAGSTAGAAT